MRRGFRRRVLNRFPGFDPLRLIAAASVVFSHAFLLADGSEENEPFLRMTGQIIGLAGVYVFFILSGFLISESARRSRGLSDFALRRAARILPGFLACNLLATLIVALLFVPMPPLTFLGSYWTWKPLVDLHLLREKGLYFHDVSFYPAANGPDFLRHEVNGSLWTIRQEITCYGFVATILVLGLHGWRAAVLALLTVGVFATGFRIWPILWSHPYLSDLKFVAPSFAAGICLNAWARDHVARGPVAAVSALVLLALALGWPGWGGQANLVFPALAAYPLLYLGQRDMAVIRLYARGG